MAYMCTSISLYSVTSYICNMQVNANHTLIERKPHKSLITRWGIVLGAQMGSVSYTYYNCCLGDRLYTEDALFLDWRAHQSPKLWSVWVKCANIGSCGVCWRYHRQANITNTCCMPILAKLFGIQTIQLRALMASVEICTQGLPRKIISRLENELTNEMAVLLASCTICRYLHSFNYCRLHLLQVWRYDTDTHMEPWRAWLASKLICWRCASASWLSVGWENNAMRS